MDYTYWKQNRFKVIRPAKIGETGLGTVVQGCPTIENAEAVAIQKSKEKGEIHYIAEMLSFTKPPPVSIDWSVEKR